MEPDLVGNVLERAIAELAAEMDSENLPQRLRRHPFRDAPMLENGEGPTSGPRLMPFRAWARDLR